jgi:homoserine O-acetyltransferase
MNRIAPFPEVDHQRLVLAEGLALDCGVTIRPLSVAYRTYGTLNAARSNAVLVCHALTGDQYVAETQPVTGKPGWWDSLGRPRPAGGHRPLLRHLRQRARRLHGLHRPARGDDG